MATDKIQINLRVPDDLREKIQSAASERGVSVNKEITDRLLKSFNEDVSVSASSINNELYAILRVVTAAMDLAGPMSAINSTRNPDAGRQWINNSIAYHHAIEAAVTVLEGFKPLTPTPPMFETSQTLGVEIGRGMLEEAATGLSRTVGPTEMTRAAKLNAGIGSLADRIERFDARKAANDPGPITVRLAEGVSARLTREPKCKGKRK